MPTLNWIHKELVESHHDKVPYRLLKGDAKLSVGPDGGVGSGNLLVQGDNLDALKALLPYYGGKVKCIYIDPPYNTGNEGWVYNDNVNSPEMRAWLGQVVGKEAEDLSRHDKWLCMMYPRLALLRQFLTDDGAIFVSIDDNEVQNLRGLMDEVFGRQNFVTSIVWEKTTSARNDAKYFSGDHEYVLLYARNMSAVAFNGLKRTESSNAAYTNPDNDPRGPWRENDYKCAKSAEERPNLYYPIRHPVTGEEVWPRRERVWAYGRTEHERHVAEDMLWWGKTGNYKLPKLKKFMADADQSLVPRTLWFASEVDQTRTARQEILDITPDAPFATPKPVRLLQRVIELTTRDGDIIMDSFAGSGTTGHAVLAMNKADGGNRRFILIEMDPTIATTITAQRLTKVIDGYHPGGDEGKPKVEGTGGGFRFATLGPTLFDEFGRFRTGEDKVTFAQLAAHLYFAQTGEPQPTATTGRKSPHIGTFRGTAYYLLYNGILGDKTPDGGNVLTRGVLASLPKNPLPGGAGEGPKVVFGEACRLSESTLRKAAIEFRQIPYRVEVG
jgi:adenine-specific DNA-methyltransferase